MDPSDNCPEPGTWKTFLDGELLDEASADLAAHLEECEACQQTLERLAAGKETWEGTAKQLAEADANADQLESSGHLRDVLDDLKQGIEIDSRTTNITPESLTFLSESDEKDSIGKLGNYEVLEIVGAGGMGIVMRAWDPSLRRIVAIKVLASHLANSAAARRRFVREAQAAAAVSHDHVVAIHAVEADHEPPYLVMQYIEGKTLQQRLDGVGPLNVREVLRIGQQTALGLSAAHQQGIVHRDIKPANILLENGVERVRITDFGLARAIDDASMTQSGVVAGTPLFMAPEQAQGIQLDHRADLFSLGSVLYVMCTGRPPFRSSTMIGVIRRVCDDSPRPIREINPDVPDWLCAVIDRLLAKDPKDRYPSAEEIAELLGNYLAHVQQPTVVPLPTGLANSSSVDALTEEQSSANSTVRETTSPVATPETHEKIPETSSATSTDPESKIAPVTPAGIRREVFWPATLMITAGVANLLASGGMLLYLFEYLNVGMVHQVSSRLIALLPQTLVIYGALRMLRFQSRVWGIVAAIVCLLAGPCYPLSWPASIWALAVLMRPHVQREFVRISNERRQSGDTHLPDDEPVPGETRPIASFGQKIARVLLLLETAVAGMLVPFGGMIAFRYEGPDWIPHRFFIAATGLVVVCAAYLGLLLYRYGFESCDPELQQSRRDLLRRKFRSLGLWVGTLAGVLPCLIIALDINAQTYNDFLSGCVVPLSLIGAVLLIVGAVLNLNRAQADRYTGKNVDHPAFATLEWPTPMLAILWTAFVAWSDFQGTVGYARFQIDNPNSVVTVTSDDSRISRSQRGGWRKLRIPEGKYYWTVSDPGILDDHAVNGTVDIESPRTSVIDAEIHRSDALERSEGYWRCVSTDSVLNGSGVEDCEWAKSPGWIAIDKQFVLSWDASGNLIGNWSLKRKADSSPKTLEIVDILSGDLIGEGQWAVSQKQLLLRLYPPRKTTSPYLASIFSKPTNGDLLEWRFEKLQGAPAWADPNSLGESVEPFASAADNLEPDQPTNSSSGNSDLEGRWILDSVQMGGTSVSPKHTEGELIFVGDWQLSVNPDGTITKSIVSTRTDTSPKRIRIETQTEKGKVVVLQGVYRVDDKGQQFRSLQLYLLQPGFANFSRDTKPDSKPLTLAEMEEYVQLTIESLTDRCFDETPVNGALLMRGRMSSEPLVPSILPPNIVGKVLDIKQSDQNGRMLVEISVGADDGLKGGDMLTVDRAHDSEFESVYVGTIRLELVTPDRSVGSLVERGNGITVEKEDRVTSKPFLY